MLRVGVTEQHIKDAQDYVDKYNTANRGEYDGDKFRQFIGRLGEVVICGCLGVPTNDKQGFDNGVDATVGTLIIDIKTKARNYYIKPWYVWNVPLSQLESERYLNNTYMFASYVQKNNILEIAGFITKSLYKSRALYIPANAYRQRSDGTKFNYPVAQTEVTQPCLFDITNWDDVLLQQYHLIKE